MKIKRNHRRHATRNVSHAKTHDPARLISFLGAAAPIGDGICLGTLSFLQEDRPKIEHLALAETRFV